MGFKNKDGKRKKKGSTKDFKEKILTTSVTPKHNQTVAKKTSQTRVVSQTSRSTTRRVETPKLRAQVERKVGKQEPR